MKVSDVVKFRGDRLFNGAVNIDWYLSDPVKAQQAGRAFVFHGPNYHGVSQDEVGFDHGHSLIDTASITKSILRRSYGLEDVPFTLAIAGYGTGKSHLGVTLAELLSNPQSKDSKEIIERLETADKQIGAEVRVMIGEIDKPCLVIALNGLQGFDFIYELSRQIIQVLQRDGHDTKCIEDLRPRFKQAIKMIQWVNSPQLQEEISGFCDGLDLPDIIIKLEQQDEPTYKSVNQFLIKHDMQIRNLQGESVRDLIGKTVDEYCGEGKPYQSVVVLFDEFGKYIEFASTKSHLAGNGVLQDLFEAIQSYSSHACFIGFIQFELNAYLQRMAPEYKNEMQRYITRYQAANKLYLSTNLETLIANLIEKIDPSYLDSKFDNQYAISESIRAQANLNRWFPSSNNNHVWKDPKQFHAIVRKGAWPLSPYSVWLLYYLTAVGGHLQERSALALLIEAFKQFESHKIIEGSEWEMAAVDLMSESFCQELLSSEESGSQGSIMQAYQTVLSKYATRYSKKQIRILKSIVLSSKLGLAASSKSDAYASLSALTGLTLDEVNGEIEPLLNEFNVIEWDEAYKCFDILGDALPRSQFINHLRKLSGTYDENSRSQLFVSSIKSCCDLIKDIPSDFAEENKISTTEWTFLAKAANLDTLPQQIAMEAERWFNAENIDDPRGTILYTYLGESTDFESIARDTLRMLKSVAESYKVKSIPIMVVLLYDEEGKLGQDLTELSILRSLSAEDKMKYGNLTEAHQLKLEHSITDNVEMLLKERRYVALAKGDIQGLRLSRVSTELFKQIYPNPIPFPFDGFSTVKGNAADTCSVLTRELMHATLDYHSIMAKPVKDKNRANSVLKEAWGMFSSNGKINRRPANSTLKSITVKWDDELKESSTISLRSMYDTLIKPPYGANLDSAGLFLSAYISPRIDNLMVMKHGQHNSITDWISDNLIKAKHFNTALLDDASLVLRSNDTSEWVALLDEWEQAEDYQSIVDCLYRSEVLRKKLPVPPDQVYREQRLRDLAFEAEKQLDEMEDKIADAKFKISNGLESGNVSQLAWGCSSLKERIDKLESEKQLWGEDQIGDLSSIYAEGRQTILQVFPDWKQKQRPKSESPDHVGEFKHVMLNKVIPNLNSTGLDAQSAELEEYVRKIIKNSENVAEAHRLMSNVNNWLHVSRSVLGTNRLKDIRSEKDAAKEFSNKLRGMSQRINLNELLLVRTEISNFYKELTAAEENIAKKANRVWSSKITDENSMTELSEELDSLIRAYDGLDTDLEDFHTQKKALQLYKRAFGRLNDLSLTWNAFSKLSKEIEKEVVSSLSEEELPWIPEDVIKALIKYISDSRKNLSAEWTDELLALESGIPKMDVSTANQLQNKVTQPPVYVTDAHLKKIDKLIKALEKRLSEIKIDWLIEKFKELSEKDKKKFLEIIR
ncbi:MAG: hypothetical protein PHW82_09110 [Bacteroidales bacterium]|nr:hypothetical protein [Bacteroidales bacterium]